MSDVTTVKTRAQQLTTRQRTQTFMGKRRKVCDCRLLTQLVTGSYWCRGFDGKGDCKRTKRRSI